MPRALDPRLEAARTGYPGLTARPLPHGRGRVPSRPAVLRSGAVYWTCRSGTRRPRCGTRPHRCRGFWRGPPRISLGTCASTYDPGRRPLCRAWPRRPVGPDRTGADAGWSVCCDGTISPSALSGPDGSDGQMRDATMSSKTPERLRSIEATRRLASGGSRGAAWMDATASGRPEPTRRSGAGGQDATPFARPRGPKGVDTVSMAGGDDEPLAPGGRQVSGGPHRASVHGMTRFMVDFGRQDRQGGACSDRSAR